MRQCICSLLLLAILPLQSCQKESEVQTPAPASEGLSAEELAAEAPAEITGDPFAGTPYAGSIPEPPAAQPPIDAADAGPVLLELMSETAYRNERGQYVVDLLERDMAYLTLTVQNQDGRPVRGAKLEVAITGGSRLIPLGENTTTDESGWTEIGVVGGKMGSDKLTVTYGTRSLDVLINVISLQAAGYADLKTTQGSLPWDALMKTRLRFGANNQVTADFPPDIAMQNGKTVKLIGFMMPLESDQHQKHFLLTSNPPSCFFHIPGGPSGAVEVFAPKGITASWDPVLLQGRFETVQNSAMGVVYRLHEAKVISK